MSKRASRLRRLQIEASAPKNAPKELTICGDSEPLEIQAGETPDKPKKFSMVAYTGGAMKVGYGYPVVVDLEGMRVPSQTRPILRQHDTERIVGHTDLIEKSQQRLKVAGVLSGMSDEVDKIASTASRGFPWQASIGASVEEMQFVEKGESAKVNGRNFDGPVYVARKTTLGEISFVTLGADGATSATVAAKHLGDNAMTPFQEWLKALGFDAAALTEAQTAKLKAQFDAETAPKAPKEPEVKAEKKPAGKVSDIVAAQRAENQRRDDIMTLTAQYAKDYPTRLDEIESMGNQALEAGWDAEKYENKLIGFAIKACTGPIVLAPAKVEATAEVLEAALCLAGGLASPEKHFDEKTLHAAHKRFGGGIGLVETIDVCAAANGYRGTARRDLKGALRAAFGITAGVSPSVMNIDGILSNTANKYFREAFTFVENEYTKISSKRSVRDFKQITSYSLTGDMTFQEVAPGGQLKHGTLGETSYNNQAGSYGILLGIDRRDLINDDLGALATVARRMGRGSALQVNHKFWTTFMDNSSFFSTGNGNYDDGTDTALSNDGLVAADILWAAMTDPDGKPMGHTARILLVPPNLKIPAWRLMNSQVFNSADEEGVANPWANRFQVVTSTYLNNSAYTGYSTKAWYLLCDPNDISVIEICYLNGQEMPTVESAELDFDRLGISMRGYFDFGVTKQEPRGGYKFKGEA